MAPVFLSDASASMGAFFTRLTKTIFAKKLMAALLLLFMAAGLAWHCRFSLLPYFCDDPLPLIERHFSSGGALTDRHGKILRVFADVRGDFSVYIPLASHSPDLLQAILTAEDRNFYQHPGFDFFAILRAAWQNLTNKRIVSGASTISQQLIRVVDPGPRTLTTKIRELLMALRLEGSLSKAQILERYLNAVSMFGNVRGINMAALLLFGKSPDMLNLAESATLAAAIQAPGRLDPFSQKGNIRLLARRNWVLAEMRRTGIIAESTLVSARNSTIPSWRKPRPFNAPHFCDLVLAQHSPLKGTRKTTIDMTLQNLLVGTLKSHLPRLMKKGALQAGGMIVDSTTLEILAMAGSCEYGPLAAGFNNVCLARRSGGSILKPFLYALALENGYFPSYVIPDTMQTFKTPQGEYQPYNADRRSYGPVTVRAALGNSLNISAVKMLNLLGIGDFCRMLVELGLVSNKPGAAEFYGLGLAIGNPELRMLDLVQAYGIFVNQGNLKSLKYFPDQLQSSSSIISPRTAYMIFDIMADPSARLFTFGNPAFFKTRSMTGLKTGTSTEYRDCWLVAVNSRFIMAFWVGNFSGVPTRALSGASACGPIFHDINDYLETRYQPAPVVAPEGIIRRAVCSISGQLPGPNCFMTGYEIFAEDGNLPEVCVFHRSTGEEHDLPADYASWLKHRRRFLDVDPFRLANQAETADPWVIKGLESGDAQLSVASGSFYSADKTRLARNVGIKIVSPHDGDCYVMSASHENYALLRAIPSEPVSEVIWLINGIEFIRTPPPYEAYWPLAKGVFRITALTESEIAAEVEIQVEH